VRGVLIFSWLVIMSSVGIAEEGFEPLFNGKDLSGWDGNPELWSVKDGAITGTTNGPKHLEYNQFLLWKGEVADFELRLEFKVTGDNNSGVQYRAVAKPDVGKWSVGGYQADIHSNPPYTGMLYDERGRGIVAKRGEHVTIANDGKKTVKKLDVAVDPIDVTKWHKMTIIAKGNHLTHMIDGVKTVEIIDNQESEREMKGLLGFQVHRGPAMVAQFRNIRIKHLKKGDDGKPQANARGAQPSWIWRNQGDEPAKQVFFRKQFTIKGAVKTADLRATCDDEMIVYVDGTEVLRHGAWNKPVRLDVAGAMHANPAGGKHVIAVHGTNGASAAGLLVRLDVQTESGTTRFVSDESWEAAVQPKKGWQRPNGKLPNAVSATVVAKLGEKPWNITAEKLENAIQQRTPTATSIDQMIVKKGFDVELLYTVPKDQEGSWVSMCTDPKGRLIVCDQYGGLFRVTPPGILGAKKLGIEKINVDIGEAQGLLWAFDSLYVVVNKGKNYDSGVYRVLDTDGDDQLDTLKTLRKLTGSGGEHGPHAVLLTEDKKGLYIVCGNKTDLTEMATSRVPYHWDEDNMLPRPYGRGFMKGTPAPGGYISRIDPEGKEWELVIAGFRNEYDAALNADGELFAYDADMEWDVNTPWYRPTRVCHAVSGADYGWRNGGAKFPEYFVDTIPAVVDIGPGSPTGVVFGYGAKFPAKYQKALFINDWSYGKMYAVHLTPDGSSYKGQLEEFISGTPLPLTDMVINPVDNAMYFAIGGRRVQSGLYKVTYSGPESTAVADAKDDAGASERAIRRKLEDLHLGDHADAIEIAWPHLKSKDRFIRTAARVAIEHRPVDEWRDKALSEYDPTAKIEALLALVHTQERSEKDLKTAVDTVPPSWDGPSGGPDGDAGQRQVAIFESLSELSNHDLSEEQTLATLRVIQLAMLRFGPPHDEIRNGIIDVLDAKFPTPSPKLNGMMLEILVYLQAPNAAVKGVELLQQSPTQEEQINYAKALRHLKTGWTPKAQEAYFEWFVRASGYAGGNSFQLFVENIKKEAVAALSDEDRARLKPILDKKPDGPINPFAGEIREFVKQWSMEEALPAVETQLTGRSYENGRRLFGAAKCFACHRFDGEGGSVGPDLTGLAGRFDKKYILESILEPSKVISDQYQAVQMMTLEGKIITGRIVNLSGDTFRVNTDMMKPGELLMVDRKSIEEMMPSKVSMMPKGLLDTLTQDELLDLMAYLLSRGDRSHPAFKK